jgi:DNA-binding transcriptional LysR family regulator
MVTLQQYRYFRELAASEHLTQTAEKLHVTQTSLSNTIINMERQIGVKLFDRTGRSIRLNEVGRAYYAYVEEALSALDSAQAMVNEYLNRESHSVSVAMSSSHVWTSLIQGFHVKYQDYNIHQVNCTRLQCRELLVNQGTDLVIAGTDDLVLSGLEYQVFRRERLYLCVYKGHPFASRESIHLAETKNESFINLPESESFRIFCDKLFQKVGISYNTSIECDYIMRGKLIEAGFGVALTTGKFIEKNMLGNNVFIPIADDFAVRPIAIIWNPRHYLGQAARDFLAYTLQTESDGEVPPVNSLRLG